jgi:hypothetical protein
MNGISIGRGLLSNLLRSDRGADRMTARQVCHVHRLTQTIWHNEAEITAFERASTGSDTSIEDVAARGHVLAIRLKKLGRVRRGDATSICNAFTLIAILPYAFPSTTPKLLFMGAIPWSPHVIHPAAIPKEVPSEYRDQVIARAGFVCAIANTPASDIDLDRASIGYLFYQCSKILVQAESGGHGERASLNPIARDEMLRSQEAGNGQWCQLDTPLKCPIREAGLMAFLQNRNKQELQLAPLESSEAP